MKSLETCLKHINNLHLPPHIAEAILRRNSPQIKTTDLSNFRFLSHPQLFKKSFIGYEKGAGIPLWDGDEVIYLTDKNKEPLAGSSFKIRNNSFLVNSIQGIRGKKTKKGKLKGSKYNILRYANWEMSLLDVIETQAKWCECNNIKVISSNYFSKPNKRLFMRYDVPCLNKNYQKQGDYWVKPPRTSSSL